MEQIELAKNVLRTLNIYSPYVSLFKNSGACCYENGIGYWASQESVLQSKINELKAKGITVYAIIHGIYIDLGELWDFLVIDNEMESVDDVLCDFDGKSYSALSYCYDTDLELIDIGDIGIRPKFGGVVRVW